MLAQGIPSFYQKDSACVTSVYSPISTLQSPISSPPFRLNLNEFRNTPRELKRNVSASLHDMGNGVLCFEFHSKGNTLDTFMYDVGHYALDLLESNNNYRALVIGSQGKDFCLGANIGMFLQAIAAAGGNFKLIEKASLDLQEFLMRFRFARKPVVTAPYQRVLGGGAEVVMAGASVVAAAETYIGLVEFGVGVIPAAGGCKELVRRNVSTHVIGGVEGADVTPHLAKVFETIAYAKVSESAHIAQQRGFLRSSDTIVLNDDFLLGMAKQKAIQLAESHYVAPNRNDKSVWAAGRKGKAVLFAAVDQLRWGKFISAHDTLIAKKLAHVLCGGDLSSPQWVIEDYILELEREAFASLLGETKTQERITHMLKYAKPLRN
jgi:3-hydroxyacyl-CoA dehydrogenase